MSTIMLLLFWVVSQDKWRVLEVSDDPAIRRMQRLYSRLKQNVKQFPYFATLTFTDKREGYFPIKDRYLESELRAWLETDNDFYHYDKKKTLQDIFHPPGEFANVKFNRNLTQYFRAFMNKMNVYSKRLYNTRFTYFWKYDFGAKNDRPHFHLLFNNSYFSEITSVLWKMFEHVWGSGYVDIEPLETTAKAFIYMSKYCTKTAQNSKYLCTGTRQWSCSRDIKKYKKSGDWIYYKAYLESMVDICNYDMEHIFYEKNSGEFQMLA